MKKKKFPLHILLRINIYRVVFNNSFVKVRIILFSPCISLFLGIADDRQATKFDKVHSHRVYSLEKHDDVVHLMMEVPDKNQEKSQDLLSNKSLLLLCLLFQKNLSFYQLMPKSICLLIPFWKFSIKQDLLSQRQNVINVFEALMPYPMEELVLFNKFCR